MDRLTLTTTGVAKGGEAIAREPTGRVVFVADALPDETVEIELTEVRRDFARGVVIDVLEPSPFRTEPPCRYVADGCGGCDLQHAAARHQLALKTRIVRDALVRQAKLSDPPEIGTVALPPVAYRTTVRGLVEAGRFAFRRRASNEPLAVDACLVAHPLVDELIGRGRFGAATEVVLRAGARTGERLARTWPERTPIDIPSDVQRDCYHEVVEGERFRISADSFFQCRPDGADALVRAVRGMAGDVSGRAADLYAGVGLFTATVLRDFADVVAVEVSESATRDCAVNAPHARVIRSPVEQWRPTPAALVIADPARAGLGKIGAARVAATSAERVVLVSCDPAAFGRDVALLLGSGYRLGEVTVVDLFGHTSHVEVVSRFDRG